MSQPIIGIPASTILTPGAHGEVTRQFVNDAYCRAVLLGGGIPMILPCCQGSRGADSPTDVDCAYRLTAQCDGLLFPGGDDVFPPLYGQPPHPLLKETDPPLNAFLLACAKEAKRVGMPVLGICMGLQLLNVSEGGTLWQDHSLRPQPVIQHEQRGGRSHICHTVSLEPDTRLRRLFGKITLSVNSMHHQCADQLGGDLIPCARAEDQTVEALESPNGRIVAVQWHPEEMLDSAPEMKVLFQDLIHRAEEFRSARDGRDEP